MHIFFLTIFWHNYAFDHQKEMVTHVAAYIFFTEWKTVGFFLVTPGNQLWVKAKHSLWQGKNFPCIWGKIWKIVPSIWLCTQSLTQILWNVSLNVLSVYHSRCICCVFAVNVKEFFKKLFMRVSIGLSEKLN